MTDIEPPLDEHFTCLPADATAQRKCRKILGEGWAVGYFFGADGPSLTP